MENKEVVINDKTYIVKEIKYKDIAAFSETNQEKSAKKMMILSTDMSEEEYDNLSVRDGLKIQKIINELNGFGKDFQKPLTE